jgi:hypothetical protein
MPDFLQQRESADLLGSIASLSQLPPAGMRSGDEQHIRAFSLYSLSSEKCRFCRFFRLLQKLS